MAAKDMETQELIKELVGRGYVVLNPYDKSWRGIYVSEEDCETHLNSCDAGCVVCGA